MRHDLVERTTTQLSIVDARAKLTRLPEQLEGEPGVVAVTRRGRHVLAILTWEDYEALVETLEIMGDPEAMEQLRVSAKQIRAGKTRPVRELGKELGFEE